MIENLTQLGRALELASSALHDCEDNFPGLDDQGDAVLLRHIGTIAADVEIRATRVRRAIETRLLLGQALG